MAAHREHFFHRTLADELVVMRTLGHHHRHAATLEVERDFVDLPVVAGKVELGLELDMLEHRPIEQVLQAGLVIAVEVGEAEHLVRFATGDVGMAGECDLVLGQGAGLVGAQQVHRAEALDRVQAFDDHLLARQHHRPARERGGDDHRQHLWRQPDRHRERKQEGRGPVTLGEAVDQQHQRHHDEREADQQPAHLVHAKLKRVRIRPVAGTGHAPRQGAEISVVAGREHERAGRTRNDVGAHEHQIGHVQRGG